MPFEVIYDWSVSSIASPLLLAVLLVIDIDHITEKKKEKNKFLNKNGYHKTNGTLDLFFFFYIAIRSTKLTKKELTWQGDKRRHPTHRGLIDLDPDQMGAD